MKSKRRLNDIKSNKKRQGISLIVQKRIIGVSTMILAALLMAVPFFSRAVAVGYTELREDVTDPNSKVIGGSCGTQGTKDVAGFGDSVKWYLAYDSNASDPNTAPLTLFIEKNGDTVNDGSGNPVTNLGAMEDCKVSKTADNRGWKDYLDRIEKIVVEDGVTEIGAYTFSDYHWSDGDTAPNMPYAVNEVELPTSLTRIGAGAFYHSGIQKIVFTTTTQPLTPLIIKESAFERTALIEIELPNTVTVIEQKAFYNSDALTTVKWFAGSDPADGMLREIGPEAFAECDKLTGTLEFPNSLQLIGYRAFFNDTKLTGTLNLPAQLTEIGDAAFARTGITGDLSIPANVTALGAGAFEGCAGLNGKLTISTGLTEIKEKTFMDCSGLTELTVGDNVQKIGSQAFENCALLQSPIVIPASVKEIGGRAFTGTDKAERIRFNGEAPTVVDATGNNNSFDKGDKVIFVRGTKSFEDNLTQEDGNIKWKGYWASRVDSPTADIKEPEEFGYLDLRTKETAIGNATATLKKADSTALMDGGKGYRLEIRDLNVADTDGLKDKLLLESRHIYHPYELTLLNERVSPSVPVSGKYVGEIEVALPLPTEIAKAARETIEQGLKTAVEERLKIYAEPLVAGNDPEKISFTKQEENGILQVTFTATHFSQYALVYDSSRYGAEPFAVIDRRSDTRDKTNSILYKGVANEGAPEQKEFEIKSGVNHATAVFTPASSVPTTNGYRLEISKSTGDTILKAEWAATGKGVLLDQYRMFAPVEIKLYYNDGISGKPEEVITEGFGEMLIRLPIPEEMDIRAQGSTLQVLSVKTDASGKNTIEVKSRANGDLEIMGVENSNVNYAVFKTDHFSEFALYYIIGDDSSSSTSASTASTAASTASTAGTTNAATTSTTTGAGTSGTASTAASTASGSSGTNASNTGSSGATNRSGATTPSSTGGGTDMPKTGDSDFYRMTLSMALMLFGVYELISTIRIKRK